MAIDKKYEFRYNSTTEVSIAESGNGFLITIHQGVDKMEFTNQQWYSLNDQIRQAMQFMKPVYGTRD